MVSYLSKNKLRDRGFTLVELLMTISIIAILSTLAIAIIRGAEDDSRASRTSTIVGLVRNVVQRRIEAYETRTVPFRFSDVENSIGAQLNWDDRRQLRERTLVEWISAELPIAVLNPSSPGDGRGQLEQFPSWITKAQTDNDIVDVSTRLQYRPPGMITRLRRHFGMTDTDGDGVWTAAPGFDPANQDAECLYAILHNSWDGDRRGTHFLTPQEIGDTDGDGFLEVLDGWGDPMIFNLTTPSDRDGDGANDVDGTGALIQYPLDPDFSFDLYNIQVDIRSVRSDNL